ncbi:hypothetical protein [Cereibacter ovatus]|uniref:hypothetical protein n=1 Tax=Cereibacter ovatus TaxID=439529 RepID=UPI001F1E8B76|nr:hypothetical protein [Cereibacter ovatus]
MTVRKQAFAQMRAQKTGATRNQNCFPAPTKTLRDITCGHIGHDPASVHFDRSA